MKRTFLTVYRLQFAILDFGKSPPNCFTHRRLPSAGRQIVRMVRNRMKDPFSTTREPKKLAQLRQLLYTADQAPDHTNINRLLDCWNDYCATSLGGLSKLALVRSRKFVERVELGRYVVRDAKGKFFETTDNRNNARIAYHDLGGVGAVIIDRKAS